MKTKALVFVSLACCLLLTGCPNLFSTTTTTTTTSTTTSTTTTSTTTTTLAESEYLLDLGGDSAVSLANFNDSIIYSIVTATPSTKPERNSAPVTAYTFTLSTAVAQAENINILKTESVLQKSPQTPPRGQAARDLVTRAKGSLLLSESRYQKPGTQLKSKSVGTPITVGTVWNGVNVYGPDPDDPTTEIKFVINATCRAISDHAYFFVDNRNFSIIDPHLVAYGDAFDLIYTTNRDKFGLEADFDENGKVIILFSEAITGGTLGYFDPTDKFAAEIYTDSNEGDIFYITADSDVQGEDGYVLGTLAHEFQHMIYFDTLQSQGIEDSYWWLDEALSQAAEYYNGYAAGNHEGWIQDFLESYGYGLSLTQWTSENYGFGAIFIRYIIDRFGDDAIKSFYTSELIGIDAVEAATGKNFNVLFTDFSRAIVMSGTGDSTKPEYGFTTLDLAAIQPLGRTGLLPYDVIDDPDEQPYTPDFTAGEGYTGTVYAYGFEFDVWDGDFGTMTLSGTDISGTAFGLSR